MSESEVDFRQRLSTNQNVSIIYFFQPNCAGCLPVSRLLEEFTTLPVERVDCSIWPSFPQEYGIRSTPTVALVSGLELIAIKSGALTKSTLDVFLESNL